MPDSSCAARGGGADVCYRSVEQFISLLHRAVHVFCHARFCRHRCRAATTPRIWNRTWILLVRCGGDAACGGGAECCYHSRERQTAAAQSILIFYVLSFVTLKKKKKKLFTTVVSKWDSSHGTFGLLSPGKASYDRVELPNLRCMLGVFGVSIIQRTLTWTDRIFNVRTDVNACDCTRGCTDTVRESALKVDSGGKIPCHTGESNLRRQRARPTLYPLSYISTYTY